MARKRTWGLEYNNQELFDVISEKLDTNMIWKDICKFFGVQAKNISTVWSWYNRRKKKYTRIQVIQQSYPATPDHPSLPIGGVPPPPPLEGVAPPPPPPEGVIIAEVPKSEIVTEEDYLLKKIEYNTNRSKKRYGALVKETDMLPTSIAELQDLQNELFSRLQTVAATS